MHQSSHHVWAIAAVLEMNSRTACWTSHLFVYLSKNKAKLLFTKYPDSKTLSASSRCSRCRAQMTSKWRSGSFTHVAGVSRGLSYETCKRTYDGRNSKELADSCGFQQARNDKHVWNTELIGDNLNIFWASALTVPARQPYLMIY